MFEVLGNTFMLGLNILCLCLFFTKRGAFPRLYITLLVANAAFLILDDIGCGLIPSLKAAVSDPREAIRAVVFGLIWSAYMLKSRRVKATFVRQQKPHSSTGTTSLSMM